MPSASGAAKGRGAHCGAHSGLASPVGHGGRATARTPAESLSPDGAMLGSREEHTPLARPAWLQENIHFCFVPGRERCWSGNVQKLNYGSPGNAPFASPEFFCCVPEDKNAQVRKCSKTQLWIPWQRTLRFSRTCLCCPRRRKRASAEMFKNLTMDSLARPCFLHAAQ